MAVSEDMRTAVREKITVPKYFDEIILPDMPDYYSDFTVDFDVKPVVKCPLHGEDVPSLRYYDDTNTYFCWGCRSGGDIIHLHREYMRKCRGEEISYENAVRFLYKYFIEGKEDTLISNKIKHTKEEDKLSSNVELCRYAKYLKNLEEALETGNNIDLEKKIKIYNKADDLELLVGMNIINASEAMQETKMYIQNMK